MKKFIILIFKFQRTGLKSWKELSLGEGESGGEEERTASFALNYLTFNNFV